jgi:geranylgeranyl diphosphate synthase type II
MGGIVGGLSRPNTELLYNFGVHLGLAFQIQDDILDLFGESAQVGKQIGGDVLANKKTLLSISAKKAANSEQRLTLQELEGMQDPTLKVEKTKELFNQLGARTYCEQKMAAHHQKALAALDLIVTNGSKSELLALAEFLFTRSY